MGVKGRALLCFSMVAQSRAFMFAPSTRRGPLGAARRSASAPSRTCATLMAYDVKYSPNRWKDEGDIVPGFGGIWPGDPDAETYHVSGIARREPLRSSCDRLSPRRGWVNGTLPTAVVHS